MIQKAGRLIRPKCPMRPDCATATRAPAIAPFRQPSFAAQGLARALAPPALTPRTEFFRIHAWQKRQSQKRPSKPPAPAGPKQKPPALLAARVIYCGDNPEQLAKLDVSPARKPILASVLWALGFHWNQRRGVWQHPCGSFDPLGSHPTDPRTKYRSYFPADVLPA